MTILGIDTSDKGLGIVLGNEQAILASYYSQAEKNHSVSLMPAIDFMMKANKLTPKDLTEIIVSEGPGSYTGLRIGVTTAKTLAWTLGIPLKALSSLAVLAGSHYSDKHVIVPVMNARRHNVYTGAYQWKQNTLVQVIEDQHIALGDWIDRLNRLNKPLLFVGDDISVFKEELTDAFGLADDWESKADHQLNPTSLMTLRKQARHIENIDAFVPTYLKKVEAEERWLENHDEKGMTYVERV